MAIKIDKKNFYKTAVVGFYIGSIIISFVLMFIKYLDTKNISSQNMAIAEYKANIEDLSEQLTKARQDLQDILNQDQYIKLKNLEEELENIKKNYIESMKAYEEIVKFKENKRALDQMDDLFTKSLTYLSSGNYSSASATLLSLDKILEAEKQKLADSFKIPENVAVNNTPPSAGYKRQRVDTSIGQYLVDIVSADLNTTRVIVDTASTSDCRDNCPVLPLSDYVSRNGAFAGINGSYFCPASYPSCAGKTNSFDTLLMNKNKTYFNSDNNVYSNVPAVIFSGNTARFVSRSLEWGRDTGVDSVLANQPLLVMGGNVVFGGDGDPKKGSKGSRSFVAAKGNTAYIGVVHNVTVAEAAIVLKALGVENALNLDSGGSTALWSGGYKVGPGRNIPNVLLFVRK